MMRWRPQATSGSGKTFSWPPTCTLSSLSLGLSHIAISHREIWRNQRNLQLSAFFCFWQGPFWPFLSSMTDCAALYEQNAIALEKNTRLSCPTAGTNLVMLQGIIAFFSHGQSCALCICISAGTMGVGQLMDREREEEGSPGSPVQEAIWPVRMDLLIFGVDVGQYESWVFVLYPDWWLKFKKNDRTKSLNRTGTLFWISQHWSFVEKVGVLFNLWILL